MLEVPGPLSRRDMGQLAGSRGEPGRLSKGAPISFISCPLNHAVPHQRKSSEQEWGDFTSGSKFIINLLCGSTEIPSTLWFQFLYLKGGIGLVQCFSTFFFKPILSFG